MGHEVETIDWNPYPFSVVQTLWNWRQRLLHFVGKNVDLPKYQPTDDEMTTVLQHTHRFVRKNISVFPQKAMKKADFKAILDKENFDAFVVGSDQVWRPSYNPFLESMFLDFCEDKDVKRIAYAASFGTSSWEFTPSLTDTCARLAKKFDLITVREKSGVNLCKEHLGVHAMQVLDPTMLLNKEDYIRLVEAEQDSESAGNLFYYILDPSTSKKALIEKMAIEHGLKPFTVMPKCQAENRTKRDVKKRIEDCVFPSVTSWLRSFMDAKMVVVDSFHGAVFSLIFNKPFWVIGNNERGNARFESLLETFGLEDRMIVLDTHRHDIDNSDEIDWAHVNHVRQKEVERCKSLLEDVI